MEKITFLLNRTVKRIEFTISHWVEVAHFILRHIDNAFDCAAASIEYSVQLASKDIGYCALWLVNTLSVKFTGKDISSDKMSVGYENSVQLTELHYCSDSAKIECLYNTKAQHSDETVSRLCASIENSVKLVTEDIATTVCKAIMRIGYYFTSKDNDGANLKATISNSVKALETHYQNDRCVIANEIPFKFRHIENDSESMRCRYFKPVKLGELDSITIGNTTKKLKDWLYTEL